MNDKEENTGHPKDSNKKPAIKRRKFIQIVGGGVAGLYVFFRLGKHFHLWADGSDPEAKLPSDFNAYLHIAEDGTVSCLTGKIEMGQGIITSLAQMLADELDVPIDKVKMVMGDTGLCPYDQGTWGSLSTRAFGPVMLAAAAEARTELLSLAAGYLKRTSGELAVKDGVVFVKNKESEKVSYGQLTRGKRIEKFMDGKAKAKDFSEYKVMGKSFNRRDAIAKVTGEAMYSGDFRVPGMVYAKILRPPSHGATLVKADTSEAAKMEGISLVRDKDLVAVLHENPEKAELALAKIKAEYTFNEMKVDDKTIFNHLVSSSANGEETDSKGDIPSGKNQSAFLFESEFYNSYVAHAAIEPHTALAYTEGDKMVVRASTQSPFGARESIAGDLGIPLEKVHVIPPFIGGGFGGKGEYYQAIEAARLAKLSRKPVMLQYSRKEEFFYDTFRPAAVVKITSGTGKEGNISLWDYKEYFAGSRGSEPLYEAANQRITSYDADNVHPFGTGAWRAPGNNTNTFARESQIDIMASKIGMDPLEFRLKNLKNEQVIAVLKAVADLFGWSPKKAPSGRGFGIACGFDAGSYVAHMAEVKVDTTTGQVQVLRVACAQDMGFCVNPEGAKIQMEGCITMGLGYVLTEEVEFTGGDIKTANFGTYKLPRFSWLPKIDTLILDRKVAPQGGGEPAIICMGGLIANAIFDATGARIYQLPMTPERVLEAMAKNNR